MNTRSRILYITVLVLLVLGGAVAVYIWRPKTGQQDYTSEAGPSVEQQAAQQKAATDQKQDFVETPPPASETPTTNTATNQSVELTAKQENDGTVTIYTKLFGFARGNCSLKVTNKSVAYEATAGIMYQPEFSSCAGFSVPVTKLGTGTWSATLTANNDGLAATRTITMEIR